MANTYETGSPVLSHDLYMGPTETQQQMIDRLGRLQAEYAELIAANPLFRAAVHTWVEQEHDDTETMYALSEFKMELDEEVEDMTKEERAQNPDADLHKMVKLRLEIAVLKDDIRRSAAVTGVNLDPYMPFAA